MALTHVSEEIKVLLDALPYIDSEYDNQTIQTEVRGLIEREMAAMEPRDYLAHLPTPPPTMFENNPILAAEMERMTRGERMAPLEVSRYEVSAPPKELLKDPDAWMTSLANARAQLEHQHNRLANLELLDKFGSQAWLQQNGALFKMQTSLASQAEVASKQAESSNLKRKLAQEKAAPRMRILQEKYYKSLNENQEVANACALLKSDVKRLREEVVKEGLAVTDVFPEEVQPVQGSGMHGGTTAADVDLYAGGEVTGMED